MRKFAIVLALTLGGHLTLAQNSAINKAKTSLEKGELDVAKQNIDMAIVHEKTISKDKTWYYKGLIYEAISVSEDASYSGLVPQEEAIKEAVAAYNKAVELGGGTSQYGGVLTESKIDNMWRIYLNKGAEAFDAKDYEEAVKAFDLTKLVKPTDTTAYMYAGIAAQQIEEYDVALANFYAMIENGSSSADIYSSVIYLEKSKNDDMEKALEWTLKAKEKFPNNQSFAKEEIQLLLNMDKIDEAKVKLEKAIEAEPDNANLYLNLAVLNDNAHKALLDSEEETDEAEVQEYFTNAVNNYAKTLELDPDNIIANYNIAVLYNDKANIYYKEVNAMGIKEYQKRGEEVSSQGTQYIEKALPFMEKSLELDPTDIDALSALQIFYVKLKMMDKAEAMATKLEKLETEQ